MGCHLSNLILDVSDLQRSLAFYHELLDLPLHKQESYEGHKLAYLDIGGTELLLLEQPKQDQNPGLDRGGGLVMKFYMRNLSRIAASLTDRSVRILQALDSPLAGEKTFLIADPDGYAILLAEPVETLN